MSPHIDADALAEALTEARCSDLPRPFHNCAAGLYLLIDPMLGDPVLPAQPDEGLGQRELGRLRDAAWERATFALELPHSLGLDAALAPYLVALKGATDPWLTASIAWAVHETVQTWLADEAQPPPHRTGGWLQSAALGPQLAQTLSAWLKLSTRTPTSARYLRLADRRVLSLAAHVLGATALAQRMPPVQHWHWLDPKAAWCSLSAASANAAPPPHTAHPEPLATFEPAQWAQMTLGERLHSQMAQAHGQLLTQERAPHPAQWPPISADQWQAALHHAGNNRDNIRGKSQP